MSAVPFVSAAREAIRSRLRPAQSVRRPLRAKLIFNPISGRPDESPHQLAEILTEMQNWLIRPEVYMVHEGSRVKAVAANAIRSGMDMVVVGGGDGTVDPVMEALVGTTTPLGIVPTGTRNNVAYSLGIPNQIPQAIALLREGRRRKLDVGHVRTGRFSHWFLEGVTVGIASALFPAADDIQHGNLARIGDLLATLITHAPSEIWLTLDGSREPITTMAHLVLARNIPYAGPNLRVAPDVAYDDGLLDVLVFSELSKLELISYAVQEVTGGTPDDPRIHHYRVKSVTIHCDPPMPVVADGVPMGEGQVSLSVLPHGLTVMAGENLPVATEAASPPSETGTDGI